MILNKKNIEIEQFGLDDTDTAYVSSISQSSQKAFFRMLTEGFYADAIGSIIREITSNCIDANTESGSDEPIIIKFEKDIESSDYILSFKDNGVGLSPERINDVYVKFLESTKKESEQEIGYFGLGSKTPFAYKRESGERFFYIDTISNGIKY